MRLCACFVTHPLLEHTSTALLSWSQRTSQVVNTECDGLFSTCARFSTNKRFEVRLQQLV